MFREHPFNLSNHSFTQFNHSTWKENSEILIHVCNKQNHASSTEDVDDKNSVSFYKYIISTSILQLSEIFLCFYLTDNE